MAKYLQNVSIDCTLLNNCGENVQIPPIKCGENVQIPPIKCGENVQKAFQFYLQMLQLWRTEMNSNGKIIKEKDRLFSS